MLFDCDELYVTPLWIYTHYVCNNLDCILKTDSAMDEIALLTNEKSKKKRLANNLENYTIRRSTNNSVCADGQAKNRFKRLHNYTISNKMRRPAKCCVPTHTANVVQKKNKNVSIFLDCKFTKFTKLAVCLFVYQFISIICSISLTLILLLTEVSLFWYHKYFSTWKLFQSQSQYVLRAQMSVTLITGWASVCFFPSQFK